MSNNPLPPIIPGGNGGPSDADATKEVDGADVLDADADDDLMDSADADVLASTDPDDRDDEEIL